MKSIDQIFDSKIRLPSPPSIAVRILDAVKNQDASFDALARIIESDPALAGKTLKIANSSFYSPKQQVDTIRDALSILGTDVLKNIALSFVISRDLRGESGSGFDFEFFWKRAVTAAIAAEALGARLGKKGDHIFVTALLQDIGIIIMYLCCKNDYMKVKVEKKDTGRPCEMIEQAVFGFDHAQVGARLLAEWGLPDSIYLPVRYHHAERGVPARVNGDSALLCLSNRISSFFHTKPRGEKYQSICETLNEKYQLDNAAVENLLDNIWVRYLDMLGYFDMDPGKPQTFDELIQEANEELGKMTLSYGQLVAELTQQKNRAEKLASELRAANDRLKELVVRDGLTGIYNHRYFQEQLEKELKRSVRYRRPLSLLMFDLDHFKRVNDRHGHLIGDKVLRNVSLVTKHLIRETDLVARYGGEEFAIILPETDPNGAAILGTRLLKAIRAMRTPADGKKIAVTVSVGITTFNPSEEPVTNADIIAVADRALYHAKHTGRNRISSVRMAPAGLDPN